MHVLPGRNHEHDSERDALDVSLESRLVSVRERDTRECLLRDGEHVVRTVKRAPNCAWNL